MPELDGALPEWAEWKGDVAPPLSWWAVNPDTGVKTLVYRDYEAYCFD